jgi:hypothetical protein
VLVVVSISDLPFPNPYQGNLKHSRVLARLVMLAVNKNIRGSGFLSPSPYINNKDWLVQGCQMYDWFHDYNVLKMHCGLRNLIPKI